MNGTEDSPAPAPAAGLEASASAEATGAVPADAAVSPTTSFATAPAPAGAELSCPWCGWRLAVPDGSAGAQVLECASCKRGVEAEVFPAFHEGVRVGRGGAASLGDEATCFYHDSKRAEAVCDRCGRYVCALCEIRLGGRRLCLECFEQGRKGRTLPHVVRFRLVPASLALWLSIGSLALSIFGVVSALAAIFVALWGLRGRPSITGRRSIGTVVLALCVAIGVITFWSAIFGALFLSARTGVSP